MAPEPFVIDSQLPTDPWLLITLSVVGFLLVAVLVGFGAWALVARLRDKNRS